MLHFQLNRVNSLMSKIIKGTGMNWGWAVLVLFPDIIYTRLILSQAAGIHWIDTAHGLCTYEFHEDEIFVYDNFIMGFTITTSYYCVSSYYQWFDLFTRSTFQRLFSVPFMDWFKTTDTRWHLLSHLWFDLQWQLHLTAVWNLCNLQWDIWCTVNCSLPILSITRIQHH